MRRMVVLLPVLIAFQAGAPPALAWTWPVDGPVLRPFQFGDDPYAAGQHRGVDVGAAAGDTVRAPVSGIVSFAGTVPGGGRTLTVQTANGLSVTLVHLGAIAVARAAEVEEGVVVGEAGPSGEAEHPGPYVHLGVRRTDDADGYLDPLAFLPARGPGKAPAATNAEPAPASTSAPEAVPAAPATASPNGPEATATPPHHAGRRHRAHEASRPHGREVAPGTQTPAVRAAGNAEASTSRHDAEPASGAADSHNLAGSLGLAAAPEFHAPAAGVGSPGQPAARGGSHAVQGHVAFPAAAVAMALLAVAVVAIARSRRSAGPGRAAAGAPDTPGSRPACEPLPASPAHRARPRPSQFPSPRCGVRGRPHRSSRRRVELLSAS